MQRAQWGEAVIPLQLRRQFPDVLWDGDPTRPKIALTFDDGPDPRDTPPLLDVLARHGVTATFCYVGERVAANPDLAKLAAAAGHQIGLHGERHRAFVLEREPELRAQLDRTRDLLAQITQGEARMFCTVRPPYGIFTPHLVRLLREWGYRMVVGSLVPMHWIQPAERTIDQVFRYTEAGSLIVLHESLAGPPIAGLVDTIVAGLKTRGFEFMTIDEMRDARA
ncbi:MAG: polysaccharide deacetylase family protein [Roseiflexaceae bacterium]|nr:polysaccharide deacetylase family protein [Roseiflexaceae bacterium]